MRWSSSLGHLRRLQYINELFIPVGQDSESRTLLWRDNDLGQIDTASEPTHCTLVRANFPETQSFTLVIKFSLVRSSNTRRRAPSCTILVYRVFSCSLLPADLCLP